LKIPKLKIKIIAN